MGPTVVIRGVDSEPPAGFVLIGRLGRVFGLEGGMHFRPYGAAEARAIFELDSVFVTGLGETPLRQVKEHGDSILVFLDPVRTRERAQRLVNADVYGAEEHLPVVEEGELYRDTLTGLSVLLEGESFGKVSELIGVPGAEILVVAREAGSDLLVPLHAPYVRVEAEGVLIAEPPPGLLDES